MAKSNKIHRALLSVSDKSGIVDFARSLHALDIEIISTSGAALNDRAEGTIMRVPTHIKMI